MSSLFSIRYKDVELDVAAGSHLTVEWMSVMFNEDQLFAGSYSYPVVFPFTPRNRAALNNAHLPENRRARRKLPVLVQLFGQSWKRATLAFDVVANGFEGDLQIDSGTVAEWMRERTVASVFTFSENGKFVDFRKIKVSSTNDDRYANVLDSCENPGKWPWVFFPIRNELKTGELEPVPGETPEEIKENERMFWFINEWGGGFFTPQENRLFTPFFYLTWVIKEVCTFLGFEARGSFLDHPEVKTWVIWNTGMIGSTEFNSPSLDLCPARHLPGMSIADFIKALRNDYKVAIYFDSHTRIATFDLADDILSRRDAVDIAGNVEKGSLRIKHNPVLGYELKTLVDDGDECYKLEPYPKSYFVGSSDSPKVQELQTGTLFMYQGPMYLNKEAEHRVPWARQTGNIYDIGWKETQAYNPDKTYGKNDFKLRMIAYKGMVPWGTLGNSGMIPYATCDNLDQTGTPAYDYSLGPGGETGWLTKFCLNWYDMLCNTEQTDLIARLPVTKFMQLAPLRKFLYSGDSRARIEALPDRVTFEPTETGGRVMVCRILGYPFYNMGALADEIKVGFTEGEIIKPDQKIYVRLSVENERFRVKKPKLREIIGDVVLRFYRDPAGSLPISVSNLPVRIVENYTDTDNRDLTFNHPVNAIGSEFTALKGVDTHIWKKATIWNLWDGIEAWHQYWLDTSPDNSYEPVQ